MSDNTIENTGGYNFTRRNFSLTKSEFETLKELKLETGFSHSLLIRIGIELVAKKLKQKKIISLL